VHVDVRIVAATHRDLEGMVADGRFRHDLWYRVAVFPIYLPPLRERPIDIPAMAAHFALRAARRLGMPPLSPTAEDIGRLLAYSWPGNVRELASVIERAAILGNGEYLDVAGALGGPRPARVPSPARSESAAPLTTTSDPASPSLDASIARHIEAALIQTRGRVEGPFGAAALLNVNPQTLRSRMKKLKIDWRQFRHSG
jgi:hydrogenase-4 transcriptional activator